MGNIQGHQNLSRSCPYILQQFDIVIITTGLVKTKSHACIPICTSILVLKAQCDAVNTCAWYQFDWSHNEESVPSDEALLYLKVTLFYFSSNRSIFHE